MANTQTAGFGLNASGVMDQPPLLQDKANTG